MSPGSRVPSGVYPSKGMPPFPILPPTGAEAPFRESTKVLTWVALCVQPGGHRADAAEAARSRPPTCPLQGGSGRSEIQTSHVPTAGQTWPGQQDPGLTCAHCRADAAAVRSRPHTCPLRAEAAGAARSRPHTRPLRAEAAGAARSRPHTRPLRAEAAGAARSGIHRDTVGPPSNQGCWVCV